MITRGYNARDLRISSILSIPKDMKSSLTSSDNYRGISLFNSICKVFDYTILDLCNDYFMTSVNCLYTLCQAKSSHLKLNGLSNDEINYMIDFITTS